MGTYSRGTVFRYRHKQDPESFEEGTICVLVDDGDEDEGRNEMFHARAFDGGESQAVLVSEIEVVTDV